MVQKSYKTLAEREGHWLQALSVNVITSISHRSFSFEIFYFLKVGADAGCALYIMSA